MQIIKGFLILALVVTMIGAGFFVALRYIPTEKIDSKYLTNLNLQELQKLQPSLQQSFSTAGQTLSSVQQFNQVLGAQEEEQKNKQKDVPSTQQAFEYSRYQYCQQVIKDYETRYPEKK